MHIESYPRSRFAWPGAEIRYQIHVEGAETVALGADRPDGLEIRLEHVTPTPDGCEAELDVRVLDGPMACIDVPLNARDSSGESVRAHVEVITTGMWMLFAFVAACVFGVLGVYWGTSAGGLWGWLAIISAGVTALVGLGSLIASLIGRYAGMPWLFTP